MSKLIVGPAYNMNLLNWHCDPLFKKKNMKINHLFVISNTYARQLQFTNVNQKNYF